MQRAIIYTRQSVAKEETISHEAQEAACRTYAASKGYEVLRVETDPGISGLNLKRRKALDRSLEALKAGEAQVLLVWRWSRLSRQRLHQALLFSQIDDAGGRVESALEATDDTAAGRFSREVLLAMAAFESEQRGETWKEAHASRLSKGLPPQGHKRFGYIKDGRSYTVDPATAPVVRELYRRYIGGAGFSTLAGWLTEQGFKNPDGVQWTKETLRLTMDNPFYKGVIRYKGAEHPGAHEALVTDATWNAYRRKRAEKAKEAPQTKASEWAFAGMVRCSKCGGAMSTNRNKNRSKVYLHCAKHRRGGECPGVNADYGKVNLAIWNWFGSHLEEWAKAVSDESEKGRLTEAVERAQAERDEAQGKLDDLIRRAVVYGLSDADVAGPMAEFREALREADERLSEAMAASSAYLPAADIHELILRGTEDLSVAEWRDAAQRVLLRVDVLEDGSVSVVPR